MVVSLQQLRDQDAGVLTEGCPTRVVLDHVTSKWGTLVLAALAGGTLRWGELRREVDGISEKMLAATCARSSRTGSCSHGATRRSAAAWTTPSPRSASSWSRPWRRC